MHTHSFLVLCGWELTIDFILSQCFLVPQLSLEQIKCRSILDSINHALSVLKHTWQISMTSVCYFHIGWLMKYISRNFEFAVPCDVNYIVIQSDDIYMHHDQILCQSTTFCGIRVFIVRIRPLSVINLVSVPGTHLTCDLGADDQNLVEIPKIRLLQFSISIFI